MRPATELENLLGEAESLTIVCHNNPDPDCLASALALGRIAAAVGIDERRILYSGEISHQQNRSFVNLLEMDIQEFDAADVTDRESSELLAFVDHSIPGSNNRVPEDISVDIVIDHHPAEDIAARFIDHRVEIGATATILTEYLRDLDIELDDRLATALLFAIRRETLGFLRGVTTDEHGAAGFLTAAADSDLLRQLSSPSVSGATVDAIADAIENRTVKGSVLISHVGRTQERDALPQAADYLATLEASRRPLSSALSRTPSSSAPGQRTPVSISVTFWTHRWAMSGARVVTERWPAARSRSASSPITRATTPCSSISLSR